MEKKCRGRTFSLVVRWSRALFTYCGGYVPEGLTYSDGNSSFPHVHGGSKFSKVIKNGIVWKLHKYRNLFTLRTMKSSPKRAHHPTLMTAGGERFEAAAPSQFPILHSGCRVTQNRISWNGNPRARAKVLWAWYTLEGSGAMNPVSLIASKTQRPRGAETKSVILNIKGRSPRWPGQIPLSGNLFEDLDRNAQ
ncbi:hypothetical protein CDAR_533401 [Caerostris darwini]|uniref:Uncharacterized protein n=1 Tax=Caerostris darwini TaxID=1538125 RepID=A0AAV4S8W5_9ARAC|nr:hypothetical protein CDAR_533401 [Caerostris darwini]